MARSRIVIKRKFTDMKVLMLFLLLLVVFLAGSIMYNMHEAAILCIVFLLLFGLYELGEYLKQKLNKAFLTFPPDSLTIFSKAGEKLKNISIILFLGSSGFSVYSICMAIFKIDFMYLESMKEAIMLNSSIAFKLNLTIYFAYYVLLGFSIFEIYIKNFCILLSLTYAPATPSNKKIIEELDAKMKKYLPFGGK